MDYNKNKEKQNTEKQNTEKQNAGNWSKLVYIGFFAVLLYGIMLCDILTEDRFFSETENRILAERPEADRKSVMDGSWEADYEIYLTDQFAARDQWIGLKTFTQKMIGKRDINGVYLAKDGYLIGRHTKIDIDGQVAEKKLERLQQDVREWQQIVAERKGQVRVLLVPTADMILSDKLPPFAQDFDQLAYLKRLDTVIDVRVPVEQVLLSRREEEIYYRTDHHWTTLGAYYGYTAWAQSMGIAAQSLSDFERETVSENFLGTLHSKLNLKVRPDRITLFHPKEKTKYRVWYDLEKEPHTGLYEMSYLETKNQYGIFLDDNHALVRIENNSAPEGSILVLKDSYANCFVPFLSAHYRDVYLIDKRYYRGKTEEFIRENDIQDVLVLYDVIHFIENKW